MSTQSQEVVNQGIKPETFGQIITRLINKEDLNLKQAKEMFYEILADRQTDMHQGAFLAAMSAKGPTADEMAGSFEAIYELDTVKIFPQIDKPLVENSGTGMDSVNTFNISTAASIIAAAAGVVMAKHGSRAITSSSGTIDILEKLGVNVECEVETVINSIEKAGIGIFNGMSPRVHPKALARILSQISFGTILNISASLANPVMPKYGVRGVNAKELLNSIPYVMKKIGYERAIVVHGTTENEKRGVDEASTLGKTYIAELKDGEITNYSFEPEDVGLTRTTEEKVMPYQDIKSEAKALKKVLSGEGDRARTDIVCLNSALILYLMDICSTIVEGIELSRAIIESGEAIQKLQEWIEVQS